MSLGIARKPYSVKLKSWLLSHLLPAEFSTEYHKSGIVQFENPKDYPPKSQGTLNYLNILISAFVSAWQETFEHDGVNISDGSYTLAPDHEKEIKSLNGPSRAARYALSYILVFLGFPSRAISFVKLANGSVYPIISFKQFFLNLIGGWDSDPKISLEKKIWQWISSPFKIYIIFPIKLLTLPIKLIINFWKLVLECGPLMLASYHAGLLGLHRGTALGKAKFPSRDEWKKNVGIALLKLLGVGLSNITYLVLGSLYFGFRLLALVSRAALSPDKSFRMAFDAGRELEITFGNSEGGRVFGRFVSNLIGAVFAMISLSITTTIWILAFPLLLNYIPAAYPMLVQFYTSITQLPAVVAVMTWVANLPVISASIGVLSSLLSSLGLALSSAFGPAIGALAVYYGVQVTLGAMITGTAVALVAAISSIPLAKLGDFLSNTWNAWVHGGPITSLIALFTPKSSPSLKSKADDVPVQMSTHLSEFENEADDVNVTYDASVGAQRACDKLLGSLEEATVIESNLSVHYTRESQTGTLSRQPDFADLYQTENDKDSSLSASQSVHCAY